MKPAPIMLPLIVLMIPMRSKLSCGLTCDSDELTSNFGTKYTNAIYLPVFNETKPLYIGFFHTGAYQETIGGYGGVHHCLMP